MLLNNFDGIDNHYSFLYFNQYLYSNLILYSENMNFQLKNQQNEIEEVGQELQFKQG